MAKKEKSMGLTVAARERRTRRRAGFEFGPEQIFVPADQLNEDKRQQILSDPYLISTEVASAPKGMNSTAGAVVSSDEEGEDAPQGSGEMNVPPRAFSQEVATQQMMDKADAGVYQPHPSAVSGSSAPAPLSDAGQEDLQGEGATSSPRRAAAAKAPTK